MQNYADNNPIVYTNGWVHGICEKCARELSDKKNNINKITDMSSGSGYGFLSIFNTKGFQYNEKYYDNIFHAYIDNCNIENIGLDEQWINELIKNSDKNNNYYRYVFIKNYIFKKSDSTWDYDLLKNIIKAKFSNKFTTDIKTKLLNTNNKEIIWYNMFDDNELGQCMCKNCRDNKVIGKNLFGKILMEVRNELK
jgi:predicted NAD-dependent protein-ADP-ribosyltransferase YbiA (DUF1768 family)